MNHTNRKRPAAITLLAVATALLGWSIYTCGSPDREVAGLVDARVHQLSDAQIAAKLSRRLPPGTTQEAALAYLFRHGVDRHQIISLWHEPPGGKLFILIRNHAYIPNPIIRSHEYFLFIYVGPDGNVSRITLSHQWDSLGFTSAAS
jgi:hypothetical protein